MDKQKQDSIIQSYKKKKRINIIITVVVFATAFFAFWFTNNRDHISDEATRAVIIYIIWIIAIGGLVLSYFNWRCPACKQHLGRSMGPKVCRKCGAKFQ